MVRGLAITWSTMACVLLNMMMGCGCGDACSCSKRSLVRRSPVFGHKIRIVHAELFSPAGVEERRVNLRRAGNVRIGLGGHIKSAAACAGNHAQTFGSLAQATAVDMGDMQRRTGDRSRSDDLAHRFDAVAPAMHEHRHAAFGGDAKHLDDFLARRPRRVLNTHADAKAARVEFVPQPLLHTFYLFRGGWVIRRGAGRRHDLPVADGGPAEDGRARPGMAGARPVIDERGITALVEKLTHVGWANLELQRGGHTIHRLQAVAGSGLVVLVEIDEAGSDDETRGVNDTRAN